MQARLTAALEGGAAAGAGVERQLAALEVLAGRVAAVAAHCPHALPVGAAPLGAVRGGGVTPTKAARAPQSVPRPGAVTSGVVKAMQAPGVAGQGGGGVGGMLAQEHVAQKHRGGAGGAGRGGGVQTGQTSTGSHKAADGVGEEEVAEVRADARRLQQQLSRMEHGETAQQHSSVVDWMLGGHK